MFGWFSVRKDLIDNSDLDSVEEDETQETEIAAPTKSDDVKQQSNPNTFLGGYRDVYEEMAECLLASMVIYGLADIRALAASSPSLSKLLELPQSRTQLLKAFMAHEEELKGMADLDTEVYMSALDTLAPDLQKFLSESEREDPVEIVAFDDESSSLELVYSVSLDHARKLIRVSFRGSTTVTDWVHDAHIVMENVDNPIQKMEESTEAPSTIRQSRKIGLHAGFRSYLFCVKDKDRSDEKVPRSPIIESLLPANIVKQGDHCKYDCILRQIKVQLEVHPEYTIQVTGHSLGAALATLLAFCLACELENIPNGPITCVSFASPRVGNGNFCRAFQELEQRGRLRNIRVANAEDVVTAVPDTSFSISFLTHAMRSNFFLHTGACYQLGPEKGEWVYPRISLTKDSHFKDDWGHRTENLTKKAITLTRAVQGQIDFLRWHSCDEYLARLRREKEALSGLVFPQVYEAYFSQLEEDEPVEEPKEEEPGEEPKEEEPGENPEPGEEDATQGAEQLQEGPDP